MRGGWKDGPDEAAIQGECIVNEATDNATPSRELLRAEGVWKTYEGHEAVRGVSFSLRQREIVGIIGPSGSGKTTLLKCIDMLEMPDRGRITYQLSEELCMDASHAVVGADEDNRSKESIHEGMISELRRNIGFVFQGFNLWEERTVLGNLTLAPVVVRRLHRDEANIKAKELCCQFGLEEKLYARVSQLSGGQKQRVAIARALMMEPKLMLLDEITSALDPVLTVEIMQAIRQLRDQGLAMVVVSHHIEFASSLCDRLMFLSNGEVVQLDTPERLRDSPATAEVQRFLDILRSAR